MAISEADIKLLWGRAAGMCSRPGCGVDLTSLPEGRNPYTVGEMAHVIARSAQGPRGDGKGSDNSYQNLILLCPTCHRHVDKAPDGEFEADELRRWKREHEGRIRALGAEHRFGNFDQLAMAVNSKLIENRVLWETFGPKSKIAEDDPGSNAFDIWELRRADRIVPNNRSIINMIRVNEGLLSEGQRRAFADFQAHTGAYEHHVDNPLDSYPLFPSSFEEAFSRGS